MHGVSVTSHHHHFVFFFVVAMDDLSLEKIEVSGPALTSLLQRVSSFEGDVDGLIFGQINRIISSNLSDDSPSESSSSSDKIIATATSFIPSGKTLSFYDSLGRVEPRRLDYFRVESPDRLLGWFSARRRTTSHPSLREIRVSSSLSQFHLPIEDSQNPNSAKMASCVFFLLTTPLKDQVIHTHEYHAYQFHNKKLEPRSVSIVNIGPAFRGHYDSFSPKSRFPSLFCEMSSSAMVVDCDESSLLAKKQAAKDQKEMDALAEGLQVGSLKRLVGAEAVSYTGGLEDLYNKMMEKIDKLSSDVERTSATVLHKDNKMRKVRYRMARIDH